MRIFLTGAQGTGKSTLVKRLAEIFPNHKMHDSMSKEFMHRPEDQMEDDFQMMISLYCLNMYVNDRDFISSRSYFDSIAYPTANGEEKWKQLLDMNRMYKPYMFQKDCIYFYLPIEFPISKSGNQLRMCDIEYQEKVDKLIKKEIDATQFNNIHTITGSVNERLYKILNILSSEVNNNIDYGDFPWDQYSDLYEITKMR